MAEPLSVDALIEQAHKEPASMHSIATATAKASMSSSRISTTASPRGSTLDSGIERVRGDCVHYLSNRLKVWDYLQAEPRTARTADRTPGLRHGRAAHRHDADVEPARRRSRRGARRSNGKSTIRSRPSPPPSSRPIRACLAKLDAHAAMLEAHPEVGRDLSQLADLSARMRLVPGARFQDADDREQGHPAQVPRVHLPGRHDQRLCLAPKFLQALQHKAPGVWNLKMPSHALHLEYLIKEYPDARLIWTHRDPYVATGSLCSDHLDEPPHADGPDRLRMAGREVSLVCGRSTPNAAWISATSTARTGSSTCNMPT